MMVYEVVSLPICYVGVCTGLYVSPLSAYGGGPARKHVSACLLSFLGYSDLRLSVRIPRFVNEHRFDVE